MGHLLCTLYNVPLLVTHIEAIELGTSCRLPWVDVVRLPGTHEWHGLVAVMGPQESGAADQLVAPYHLCVGKGVVRFFSLHERETGQRDPFSLLLFSFCASFALFRFDVVSPAHPFMYVNDLSVLIMGGFPQSLRTILGGNPCTARYF